MDPGVYDFIFICCPMREPQYTWVDDKIVMISSFYMTTWQYKGCV